MIVFQLLSKRRNSCFKKAADSLQTFFFNWCSHNRITRQWFCSSSCVCALSRSMLRRIFASQYSWFETGRGRLHIGHPCQKHPSTKMTIFCSGKAISGFPCISLQFSRQPRKPEPTRKARKRRSGAVFLLLTACIVRLRSSEVRLSDMAFSESIFSLAEPILALCAI